MYIMHESALRIGQRKKGQINKEYLIIVILLKITATFRCHNGSIIGKSCKTM